MRDRQFVQYFTNVTYGTCEECLLRHGRIARDEREFPDPGDDCERMLLPFPRKELKARKQQGRRMGALARAELRRRALMAEATEKLPADPAAAEALFRTAAAIDLFIPELEVLAAEHRETLARDDALRGRLWDLFSRAYSDKFGWPRYEQRLPEPARIARERAGLERIDSLFG
jgi:hypothetical protein